MVEMKHFLFLTDFSAEATQALAYARELAGKFAARLYLLHVIENPTSKLYGKVEGDYYAFDKNAYEKTQEWLTRLQREQLHGSPECEAVIERGDLFENVLKVMREKHIDIIVLSARVHKGFHLHLIVNLPEKLVHDAPCHVFVVHSTG